MTRWIGSSVWTGADSLIYSTEKTLKDKHKREVEALLLAAGITGADAAEFRRFGSARRLYHFNVDNADAY